MIHTKESPEHSCLKIHQDHQLSQNRIPYLAKAGLLVVIRFIQETSRLSPCALISSPECNYNNCVYQGTTVTTDTDAVYIYGVGLNERSRMPAVRLPHQVVVFSIFEPPYKHMSTAFFGKTRRLN